MRPRRLLFVTSSAMGHVTPMAAVMQEVRARGVTATCAVMGADMLPPGVDAALGDVETHVLGTGSGPVSENAIGLGDDPAGIRRRREFFEDSAPLVDEVRSLVRASKIDAVVVDPFWRTAPAIAAAQLEQVPFVCCFANLKAVAPKAIRAYCERTDRLLGEYLAQYDVRWCEDALSVRSPLLNIVPSMRELLGDGAVTDGVELVGVAGSAEPRSEEPFDYGRFADAPFVYASFGTVLYWQPDLYQALFAAAKRVGVNVLAAVGELAGHLGEVGDHVMVTRWVPQLDALARCRAFVTHCGYNSLSEGLRAGTPMVAIPLGLDQPINAHYVTRSGVGVSVAHTDATADTIGAALERVLADGSRHREAAARLSRICATQDAVRSSAELIATLDL